MIESNEGREEKNADAYISKDLFTKMINSEVIVLANDVEYVRKDVAVGIMESYANHKTEPLLDQLSKERENSGALAMMAAEKQATINGLKEQLEKKREMINELVDAFKELLKSDEFSHHFSTTAEEVEALIAKATELDKK